MRNSDGEFMVAKTEDLGKSFVGDVGLEGINVAIDLGLSFNSIKENLSSKKEIEWVISEIQNRARMD